MVGLLPGGGIPADVQEGLDGANPILQHPARLALYKLVRSNWGIWETELGRLSSMGRSNAKYHLARLVRAHLVQAIPRGRKIHYFPKDLQATELQKAIVSAQDPTRRLILELVRDQPQMSWRAISRVLKITPRAMRWHMQKLVKDNLIEVERDGMYCRARLKPLLAAVLNGDVEMLAKNLPDISIGPAPQRVPPTYVGEFAPVPLAQDPRL